MTFAWRLRVSGSGAQTSFGTGGFPLFDDEQLSRGASGPGEWSGTWTLNALGRLTLGMTTDKAATLEYRIVDVTRIQ